MFKSLVMHGTPRNGFYVKNAMEAKGWLYEWKYTVRMLLNKKDKESGNKSTFQQ